LPAEESTAIEQRFWAEGRLKLEPWLGPRVHQDNVKIWEHASLDTCRELDNAGLEARLSNGQTLTIDQVVLATGYRVDVARVPFLSHPSLTAARRVDAGFPVL